MAAPMWISWHVAVFWDLTHVVVSMLSCLPGDGQTITYSRKSVFSWSPLSSFSFLIPRVSLLCGLYKPVHGTPTTPQLIQGVVTPAKRKLSHKTVLFLLSQCPISLHRLLLALLSMALPLPGTGLTCFGWGTDAI